MKKLNLNIDGIKKMLSRDEMKNLTGGGDCWIRCNQDTDTGWELSSCDGAITANCVNTTNAVCNCV